MEPPVGHTRLVHADGATLAVTVTAVLDPLRGGGVRPPANMRPVGVRLTIANRAGATYDSTASGDVSLVLSGGRGGGAAPGAAGAAGAAGTVSAASPLFVRSGTCATPLTDFESLIGAGETRGGCVGFSVPRRARVVGVRFSPHGRARGAVAWRR